MDIEQEAAQLGWVPRDQFKGDPDKWTDAETFVQRGKEIMPILRKNNERLQTDLAAVKGQLSEVQQALGDAKEAMEAFREYHDRTAKEAYEKAIRDLTQQKKEALRDGDVDTVVEVDEALMTLRDSAPKPLVKSTPPAPAPVAAPSQQAEPPELVAWKQENSDWVDVNREATLYGASIAQFIKASRPELTGKAFLDEVALEVRNKFPALSKSAPTSKVDSGSHGASSASGGKSYNSLPPDARAACDRMAERLVGPNRAFKTIAEWRAKYVADYFQE